MLIMNVYANSGTGGSAGKKDGSRPVVNPGRPTRDANTRAPRTGLARDAQASRRPRRTALRNGRTGRA